MGMTLKREGEIFEIDLASWHFALELGRRYGWLPAGDGYARSPDREPAQLS